MKKLLSILLAVTFVLSMVTVVSANDLDLYKYENYLGKQNITGESATDVMPWNFCYAWQGLNFENDVMKIVKGNAHQGNYSLYVNHGAATTQSNEMGYHYENMYVMPSGSKNFELSFYAKFDSVTGLTLGTAQNRLVIFENNEAKADSRNTTDNVVVTKGETDANGWTKYTCTFTRNWNGANISFNIDVTSGSVVEDFYIDEIRFKNVDDDVEYIKANGWCYGGSFEYVEEWPVFKGEYLGFISGGWKGDNFAASTGIAPAHNFIEVSDDYASDGDKSAHIVWSLRDTDYAGGNKGQRLTMTHGTSIFEAGKVYKITADVKLVEGDLRAIGIGCSAADSYFVGLVDGTSATGALSSTAESGYADLGSGTYTAVAGAPEGWQRYELVLPMNRPSKGNGPLQIRVYNRQVEAYVDNISVAVKNGDDWDAVALGDGSFESVGGAVDVATFSAENIVAGDITVSKRIPYQIMNVTKDAMMSVVLYKDGRVFDIKTVDASSYTLAQNAYWAPSVTITVPDDVDAHDYYIKAMVWGRGTGMSPLCGVDTLYEAAAE